MPQFVGVEVGYTEAPRKVHCPAKDEYIPISSVNHKGLAIVSRQGNIGMYQKVYLIEGLVAQWSWT